MLSYLRECGMPESFNTGGGPIIRDKYNTKAAAAYREYISACERGEPAALQPVPWEVISVQTVAHKPMAGFGSSPPPQQDASMAGLDSLMSGFSSLKTKAKETALPALGGLKEIGKAAVGAARDKLEGYATFDPMADLAHLKAAAEREKAVVLRAVAICLYRAGMHLERHQLKCTVRLVAPGHAPMPS